MTKAQVTKALTSIETKADEVRVLIEELLGEVGEHIDSKSEKWQESDKGQEWEILREKLEEWLGSLEEMVSAAGYAENT